MASTGQAVIYRFDPAHEPQWQFHSMPESIVGGGDTLDSARAEYQAALEFTLNTNDLPVVREYIEREIGNLGIWLRIPVGQGDHDALLEDAERRIDPNDREWFYAHPTAGGEPVIVNAVPTDPLRVLLEQMTVHDSLVVALRRHGGKKTQNVYLVIAGTATDEHTRSGEPLVDFESLGLTADSPISDLVEAALKNHIKAVALATC